MQVVVSPAAQAVACPHCQQTLVANASQPPGRNRLVPTTLKEKVGPYWKELIGVVGTLATFLAAIVGTAVGRQTWQTVSRKPEVKFFADEGWTVRRMGRLSIDAPFDFKPSPSDVFPQEFKESLAALEMLQNASGTQDGYVSVLMMTARPEAVGELSLDGAMDGAMRKVAAGAMKCDPSQVRYDFEKVKVSGAPARRATFSGKSGGMSFTFDGLFILDERTLWAIQVGYGSAADARHAKRLLDSVSVSR